MSPEAATRISSVHNPRIKQVLKLRRRPQRDKLGRLLIEGYRELKRALDNGWNPDVLFFCPVLFQGTNEPALLERCRKAGAKLFECSEAVFRKIAYRDRPEGLLALAPPIRRGLADLALSRNPLVLVAERIEKPGNLGTMIRSADAAGADAVIVSDPTTDVNNPNVVRASIGTLFAVPVATADSEAALAWLKQRGIRVVAATPAAPTEYTETDLTLPTALVVGSEQYGLQSIWLERADVRVRIPMRGQGDSLNVATAATILLYEAVRQRAQKKRIPGSR